MLLTQVDGPSLFHADAATADHARTLSFSLAMPGPERLAAGHVRSGLDRRPRLAAGRRCGSSPPKAAAGYRASTSWPAAAISLVTGSVMWACVFGWLPIRWMIVSGVIFTAAFILLVPVMLGGLGRLAALLISPLLRTEGRIAHRQVLRRRVRTTLTIGVLYIAVSTAISLGTTILNNVDDIQTWVATAMKGDFFVRVIKQDLQSGLAAKMPEELVEELRKIDGVSNIDSIRYISGAIHSDAVEGGRQQVTVFVRDFTDKGNLPLMIKSGDPSTVRQQLAKGEAVIGTTLANRLKVGVGDSIDFETRDGVRPLRIAATTTAYMVGGMVVYLEGESARRLLNVAGVDVYVVNAVPAQLDEVGAKLSTICQRDSLLLNSYAEVSRHVDQLTAGVVAGLWGLLSLGLIVGAFAVANTLTMNVLGANARAGPAARDRHDPPAGPPHNLRAGGHHRADRHDARHQRRHDRGLHHQPDLRAHVGLRAGLHLAPVAAVGLLLCGDGGDRGRGLVAR